MRFGEEDKILELCRKPTTQAPVGGAAGTGREPMLLGKKIGSGFLAGFVAFFLLGTSGCEPQSESKGEEGTGAQNKSEDWRKGPDTCQVHGQKMRTVIVHDLAGPSPQFTPEYASSKDSQFPNCGIEYGPDRYGQRRGAIFVCADCEKARANWRPDTSK